ncbi:MAG: TVP38/TMEM64 family protein [Planctomycetales bacterium]|nr:TVP38/TMEM64 family protein [Planctomycetales bacterium]
MRLKPSLLRKIAGGSLLIAIVLCVSLLLLPENREHFFAVLEQFAAWSREHRLLGAILFACIYVVACVLFLPGSPITLGAGYAFGVFWGTVAVVLGSVGGATVAFLAGRWLVRDLVEERVGRSTKFAAIDRAVGEHGFKVVLLTRLSPVFPFNLLNYAYGLTRVRLRDYVLASWIGMFPATVMYVYLGSAVRNLADLFRDGAPRNAGQNVLFYVGLAATVIVTIVVTRIAKRTLGEAIPAASLDSATQERPA